MIEHGHLRSHSKSAAAAPAAAGSSGRSSRLRRSTSDTATLPRNVAAVAGAYGGLFTDDTSAWSGVDGKFFGCFFVFLYSLT